MKREIQVISAPSILGLRPGGVERLGEQLLATGLRTLTEKAVITVPAPNHQYSSHRHDASGCLNANLIHAFSTKLRNEILDRAAKQDFLLVLGGDCSILIGIMAALKTIGGFGLIFLDAHADFYDPTQSPTGEVADMDLAIVTGRGPNMLTNINELRPYVVDKHVIHVGQRDWEETKKYRSREIRETAIKCFDLNYIQSHGMSATAREVRNAMNTLHVDGHWIHFDTDVLNDGENPAVDYRLPGGLHANDVGLLLCELLATGRIAGMSVTIYNPDLDPTGKAAITIANCISDAMTSLR